MKPPSKVGRYEKGLLWDEISVLDKLTATVDSITTKGCLVTMLVNFVCQYCYLCGSIFPFWGLFFPLTWVLLGLSPLSWGT